MAEIPKADGLGNGNIEAAQSADIPILSDSKHAEVSHIESISEPETVPTAEVPKEAVQTKLPKPAETNGDKVETAPAHEAPKSILSLPKEDTSVESKVETKSPEIPKTCKAGCVVNPGPNFTVEVVDVKVPTPGMSSPISQITCKFRISHSQ
jgi:hypothetical protein